MIWEIELTLNTNIKRFETWFDKYRFNLPINLDLEDNKILYVFGAPTFERELHGIRVHEIKASIGDQSGITTLQFPVIQLELFEPADNRINIKAICKHNALHAYFIEMLTAIAKLWPEAKDKISDYTGDTKEEKEEQKTENIDKHILPLDEKPWEYIPDHLWDRRAIKMWCEGNTNKEIASFVNVSPKSVTNRISELRQRFSFIPTDEKRRMKSIIQKTHDNG